ncbi:MAG TPA: glutathione S-transferase [Thermohalobaculum sp.]|nr:glutathione S-transferase [Thermohalobaculum sp.]
MRLYHSPTSPFVRKVMVTLKLTGQEGDVELIPGSGTPLAPNEDTVGANPLGKIPALVTDDAGTLFDSRVICRYLDWRAKGGLYPDGVALFPVLAAEALADGIMEAGILAVYEWRLRPEEIRFQPWTEAQVAKVNRALAALERNDVVLTGPMNAGQIAAGCALGYVDFRFPDNGWRERHPSLAAWHAELSQMPEMQATVPVA